MLLNAACMRRSTSFVGLVLLLWLAGCSEHAKDNVALGTQPLVLQPAPGALCEGGGADKECGPDGCVQGPAAPADTGGPGVNAGSPPSPSFGSPNGSAAPSPASMSQPQQSGSSGMSAGSGGVGAPVSTGSGGATANACGAPDGGVLVDGGLAPECKDSGVAAASAALITDDVPACAEVSPQRASTLFLSADDSSSMAGPVIARRLIAGGRVVPAHVIRPWEFLNYYNFSFEPAQPGQVRIVPQLSSCPENNRLSLQVALQAEARPDPERAPLNITFVVDTSGSMGTNELGGALPIELARAAITALAGRLREGDIVSMVTWNTEQLELLNGLVVTGPNDANLINAANSLTPNGGTDLHSGLVRGYALAEQNYTPERINRLILISDGIANVGVTDVDLIAKHADDEEGDDGIYLAGIGVGDGFNDTLMNAVTDAGRGAYVYLDRTAEAERMLGERYLQVVDLAARSVRLEVTLPYYLVLEKFYGEVASTDPTKVRPQHLGPNDAMLFFQVLRACDASLLHGDDRIRMRATWQTPFAHDDREAVIDTTLNALAGNDADLSKAAAIASYAEALITAATASSPQAARAALDSALGHVQSAKNAGTDPDLIEVASLLQHYAPMFGPPPTAPNPVACGNGKVDPPEQCEVNDLDNATCASLGLGVGVLSCNKATCTYDTSMCTPQQATPPDEDGGL
jgi:Ca-activated chloride channel family protein